MGVLLLVCSRTPFLQSMTDVQQQLSKGFIFAKTFRDIKNSTILFKIRENNNKNNNNNKD